MVGSTSFGTLTRLQDRACSLIGCDPGDRAGVVEGMLHRNAAATGYWLKLVVSVGIATLGLVLDSSAIVIGAMLIAPLMEPIVNLGMGLAVGSPFLVLRSTVRVLGSVAVAIGCSAIITWLLPFNEVSSEIAARTTPTVLDLLVAAFCAIAAVYAACRQDSDIASTAAGTSIGISLVPPLCASGYGLGTGNFSVAGGAALLFLTNVVAIVVVGTVSFAAAGFQRVGVRALEAAELGTGHGATVSRRLARLFASRGGPWLRLAMPLALLAAVYVPLERGLDEVVWQLRARKRVQDIVAEVPKQVLQSHLRVERGHVELSLILVGNTAEAAATRASVEREVRAELGVAPRIEVMAIPDASSFAHLEAALRREPAPALPAVTASLDSARGALRSSFEKHWPRNQAGPLLAIFIDALGKSSAVRVIHLGPTLGPDARETLERVLSSDLEQPLELVAEAVPPDTLSPGSEDDLAYLTRVARLFELVESVEAVTACVTMPPELEEGATAGGGLLRAPMAELLSAQPRVVQRQGPALSVQFLTGACPAPEPPAPEPAEAGPPAPAAPPAGPAANP